MTNSTNTSTAADQASVPAEQAAEQKIIAAETKTAASTAAASKAKDVVAEDEKHKCAFCGDLAVFEKSVVVGGRPALSYHGCDESEGAVFEWMQATHADATAPAPETIES